MSPLKRLGLVWRREFAENVWMALETLRSHKVRSGLTILGVVIAVVTLVGVVGILMGVDRNIKQEMQSFGVRNAFFYHLTSASTSGRAARKSGSGGRCATRTMWRCATPAPPART